MGNITLSAMPNMKHAKLTEQDILFLAYDAIYPRDTDDGWRYITPTTQPNWKVDDYTANQLADTGKFVGDENGYITIRVKDVYINYGSGAEYLDCYFDFTVTKFGWLQLFRICPIYDED